jgi:hypothetical protein
MSSSAVRMNGNDTTNLSVEALGRTWTIAQQPASMNHGMVLWDAALGLLRYFEANPKQLAPLVGQRVLEVGAGTGLVGMALAHAGAHVTTTDLPSCRSSLEANVAANGRPDAASGGSIRVMDYSWGTDIADVMRDGGYSFVVGTDVGYSEALNPVLVDSCMRIAAASEAGGAAAGGAPPVRKCTVILANELRCERAHATFVREADRWFSSKQVPQRRLHPDTRHMNLQLFEMRLKQRDMGAEDGVGGGGEADFPGTGEVQGTVSASITVDP